MRQLIVVTTLIALISLPLAAADDEKPVQTTQQTAPAVEAQSPDELDQAEQEASIELAVAKIKLELVRAKKDLRAGQTDAAIQRARLILALAGSLPSDIDMDDYTLPAEGILARAGATAPGAANTETNANVARRRVLRTPASPPECLSTEELTAELERRRVGQTRSPYGTTGTSHVDDWINETDDLNQVPNGEIQYPADWADKVARRQKYAGGEIARSHSWYDAEGREWFAAVYDIDDLTLSTPDYQPTFSLDLAENDRNALDRHALRWGYGAFSGFHTWDLDTMFQVFRAFGGMDDDAWNGPVHSREKQRQVIETIQWFTIDQPPTKPQIISQEP